MDKNIKAKSKFLSFVLRHKPEAIGLELDGNGWGSIKQLLEGAAKDGQKLSREELDLAVETNDKQRFTISDDGERIRANQGHSIQVDLDLPPQEPPEILFHGTATRFLDSVLEQGLIKKERHHVHLSASRNVALSVGQRYGKPVLLLVAAQKMHTAGILFYRSENGVWLTDHVAPEFLEIEKE